MTALEKIKRLLAAGYTKSEVSRAVNMACEHGRNIGQPTNTFIRCLNGNREFPKYVDDALQLRYKKMLAKK